MIQIINKDCREAIKQQPDNSVDSCITSPPYWALRDYGHKNQIGLEATPQQYINALIEVFNEVKRVLKPEGTCFVNLNDTYSGSGGWNNFQTNWKKTKQVKNKSTNILYSNIRNEDTKDKSLLMIPYRFAFQMIENGWILRNIINWRKPNQMPQSMTDRFTVDFEPIFFFTKEPKYFFEQQFEDYSNLEEMKYRSKLRKNKKYNRKKPYKNENAMNNFTVKQGRNMRATWDINTKPFPKAHFATYPEKLVARIIKSGCPVNGTVLDPFLGSGTTAVVARKLNRNAIGYELNTDYIKIINERIYEELGMFK